MDMDMVHPLLAIPSRQYHNEAHCGLLVTISGVFCHTFRLLRPLEKKSQIYDIFPTASVVT